AKWGRRPLGATPVTSLFVEQVTGTKNFVRIGKHTRHVLIRSSSHQSHHTHHAQRPRKKGPCRSTPRRTPAGSDPTNRQASPAAARRLLVTACLFLNSILLT